MEQEETKTTAATGVEMPPEAESWVQLHESELTELMQKQAKAAITELKRQEKQERKKEKYHNTFTLMKCYRDAVFHIENAISDGQQLELKGMTDEQQFWKSYECLKTHLSLSSEYTGGETPDSTDDEVNEEDIKNLFG